MKKSFAIILSILVLTASAVTFTVIKKSKVPYVSENANIPHFIDTLMANERLRMLKIASDSSSENARLTRLGFTSKSGNVLDANTATALVTLHDVYDKIYPAHQFINYKCVDALMKEYGLSFGSTTAYIGEIPKDRIDSMERFKPSFLFDRNNWYPLHDLSTSVEEQAMQHNGYGNIGGYIETFYKIRNGKGSLGSETNLVDYAKLDMVKRPLTSTVFFIMAPSSHFNVEANEKGNYGEIKDPIVLAPVEGGYIIVTAW
jgi:hypothetical protein